MYKAVQNRSKLFCAELCLYLLNKDFEYFIHVGRVLKRGFGGAVTLSPHIEVCFDFKF